MSSDPLLPLTACGEQASAFAGPSRPRLSLRTIAVLVSIGNVVVSLALRVVHRGSSFAGFEFVGAANGLFLVSTLTPSQLLHYYVLHQFDGTNVWNTFGVPIALLPGSLASIWPSEYWPHVVIVLLVIVAFSILGTALGLEMSERWILLLAWSASSALLSYSVFGFAYISSILPYSIALLAVLRWRRWPLWTLFLSLVAVELSWHVQELGRTVFIVFLAAALFLRPAPMLSRAVWIAAAALQGWLEHGHHSFNTARFVAMTVPPLETLPAHARELIGYFIALKPDLPVLFVGGIVAAPFAGRDRWFWISILAFHLTLVFLLASNSGVLLGLIAVWPRRLLLLSFLCVAICGAAYRTGRHRELIVSLLLVGSLWQLVDTIRWASVPLEHEGKGWAFPLPYTYTAVDATRILDCSVPFLLRDWYREMRARVDSGRKLLLIYNLSSYDENTTDPAGIIDRLYLHLGHERFVDSVLVFGEDRVRWIELPIRRMADVEAVMADVDPEMVDGYYLFNPYDMQAWPTAVKHQAEVSALVGALSRGFQFAWDAPVKDIQGRVLLHFTLHRR